MSNQNNQNEKPEFVLFIMKDCKYCMSFIAKLKTKSELLAKFNIVDIEELPSIPSEINEVPCVYDGKNIYSGKKSFTWLNEKMNDFLLPANDSLNYSFIDGNEEQVFSNYSLLNQVNGSIGVANESNTNTQKKDSLESLIASRAAELK